MHKPWYKQFWPWFLIAIPLSSFGMGFFIFHIATTTNNSLVIDDYYKEGKVINARLDKIEKARQRNISTELVINDTAIAVKFLSGTPTTGEALKLTFYHVTLEDLDTSALLSLDASGVYRGVVDHALEGKWQVTLTPLDESWKVQSTLYLPQTGPVTFKPE